MEVKIKNEHLILNLYGYSGTATNKDYVGVAFKLMDKMWKKVRENGLKNEGKNIWVYDENDVVFAGVILSEIPGTSMGLEEKKIALKKYAYYKHIGAYKKLKEVGQVMNDELKAKGLETGLPYIEIYGHWTYDETKLETELLVSLR